VDFDQKYGPWAVIAGASTGTGAALSHNAAARGLNVAMLARREKQLRETAKEVSRQHGVEVRTIVGDLAAADIGHTLADATDDLEVGLLVYNATRAVAGRFLDAAIEDQVTSLAVNCGSLLVLCRLFGEKMATRRRGGIGIVTSLGAVSGSMNYAAYNAGKAFQWIVGETLWSELKEVGVDVNTLLASTISSPGYLAYIKTIDPALAGDAASNDPLQRLRARVFDPSPPEEVANALYDQLADGPVCFSRPFDAETFASSLAMARSESVALWRGLHET
jgi:short-subunit dehydrogenase